MAIAYAREKRAQHKEGHSLERVSYIASHEPSDATPPDRNNYYYCTFHLNPPPKRYNIYNTVLSGFSDSTYGNVLETGGGKNKINKYSRINDFSLKNT